MAAHLRVAVKEHVSCPVTRRRELPGENACEYEYIYIYIYIYICEYYIHIRRESGGRGGEREGRGENERRELGER
jgi:hypothetical protein